MEYSMENLYVDTGAGQVAIKEKKKHKNKLINKNLTFLTQI